MEVTDIRRESPKTRSESKDAFRLHNAGFKFSQLVLNELEDILSLPELYAVTDKLWVIRNILKFYVNVPKDK